MEEGNTMKRILLIVNPCSGKQAAKRHLADIIDIFNRADYAVLTHLTACVADGEAAVLRYADQVDMVVCCGGDGTFNETVSGVLKSGKDLPIGYIPAGSTNDFAASLNLSTDLLQAARDIVEGTPQQVDVGSFDGRYFSYVASFGAFTKASYATSQSLKNVLGHAAYILSGVKELFNIKSVPLRLELADGTVIEDSFLFGAVSNSTSMGGILSLSPDQVDMSDGQLELMLVREPRSMLELTQCVQAIYKHTYQCDMITFLSTSGIRITTQELLDWTLDGEQEPGKNQIAIDCVQRAIRVIRK